MDRQHRRTFSTERRMVLSNERNTHRRMRVSVCACEAPRESVVSQTLESCLSPSLSTPAFYVSCALYFLVRSVRLLVTATPTTTTTTTITTIATSSTPLRFSSFSSHFHPPFSVYNCSFIVDFIFICTDSELRFVSLRPVQCLEAAELSRRVSGKLISLAFIITNRVHGQCLVQNIYRIM